MATAQTIMQLRVSDYFANSSSPGTVPGRSPGRNELCAIHLDFIVKDAINTFINVEACQKHDDVFTYLHKQTTIPDNYVQPKFVCVPEVRQGMFVEYGSVPGLIPWLMKPLFDIELTEETYETMRKETLFYSKSGNPTKKGTAFAQGQDSETKEMGAPEHMLKVAKDMMEASYNESQRISLMGVKSRLPPKLFERLECTEGHDCDWTKISGMPSFADLKTW